MKKCLIVINKLSGGYKSAEPQVLQKMFGEDGFETSIFYIDKGNDFYYQDVDRVVICGGDGTFNRIINMYLNTSTEIVYCAYGTLNETSKRDENGTGDFFIEDGGIATDKYFSYVIATGTFTPLGYVVNAKIKQQIKKTAYIFNVLKQLKVWRINAKITADGETKEGQYSLVMALHSAQCFGLTFNKMFKPNQGQLFMLTVKAPRFNGFFGLAEMFFSFFRAFFIGFKKPFKSKKMEFKEIKEMHVETDKEYDFCVDGEKWTMPTTFDAKPIAFNPPVRVVTPKGVKKFKTEMMNK